MQQEEQLTVGIVTVGLIDPHRPRADHVEVFHQVVRFLHSVVLCDEVKVTNLRRHHSKIGSFISFEDLPRLALEARDRKTAQKRMTIAQLLHTFFCAMVASHGIYDQKDQNDKDDQHRAENGIDDLISYRIRVFRAVKS